MKKPLKGVRRNLIYTIRNTAMNKNHCDDNGGYTKFSSTKKSYHVMKTEDTISQVTNVHIDTDKRFFCKQRIGRGYINRFVPEREVYTLERNYRRNRSISVLRHLTVRVKSKGSKE